MTHRFDNRKQNETETLAEFEQALPLFIERRCLRPQLINEILPSKENLRMDLPCPRCNNFYVCMHATKIFRGLLLRHEATKVKKSVRFVVQPEHEAHQTKINNFGSDPNFKPLLNGFKTIIDLALKNNNQNFASSSRYGMSRDISSSLSRTDNVRALSRSPSPSPRFGNNFDSRGQRFWFTTQ